MKWLYDEFIDLRDIEEVLNDEGPDPDERAEAEAIKEAVEDGGMDFEDVAQNEPTLIADSYFETYAEEFATDIGAVGRDNNDWPLYHIDWKAAAEDLKQDYTEYEIKFDNITFTYLGRAY